MDAAALARALPSLCALALAGRATLALLPPGWPGSHAPREVAATWAASHLLGLALVALELGAARALGWNLTPPALVAPFALLAWARAALLPGAMVPRHEPPREALGPLGRGVALAGGALLALRLAARGGRAPELAGVVAVGLRASSSAPAITSASAVAVACLVVAGLERARRAPLVRASALLLFGVWSLVARNACPSFAPLFAAGAAAVWVAWLRRADRRALALGALLSAAAALEGPAGAGWAVAGCVGLVAATAGPSRARALRSALSALAVGALGGLGLGLGREVRWSGAHGFLAAWIAFSALRLTTLRARALARRTPQGNDPSRPEPPRSELRACAVVLAAGGALELWLAPHGAWGPVRAFAGLAPLALLFVGLLVAPPERPGRST